MQKIVVFLVALSIALLFQAWLPFQMVADARCPAEEAYCQFWSPKDQEQKMRLRVLDAKIQAHLELLQGCDQACIDNYDNAGLQVLSRLAEKNELPRDKVVLAMIANNYDWGLRAAATLGRPLVAQDWANHFVWGVNELADELRVNHPLVILNNNERQWCVTAEYGGTCSGRW